MHLRSSRGREPSDSEAMAAFMLATLVAGFQSPTMMRTVGPVARVTEVNMLNLFGNNGMSEHACHIL